MRYLGICGRGASKYHVSTYKENSSHSLIHITDTTSAQADTSIPLNSNTCNKAHGEFCKFKMISNYMTKKQSKYYIRLLFS
jgi:hypothetical protein